MAISDIFNSQDIQFQDDYSNFSTDQYNQNGESVNPTPPANGVTPSNDWSSDSRNAFDYKQDNIKAQVDTATQTQDDDNYYVDPTTAYKMKKVPTSMGDQIKTFITQYLISLNNHDGDAYAAGLEGGQAVQNTLDIAERQTQFHSLLAKGYNAMDIEKWAMTNDSKTLTVNKGKLERYGNVLYNTLTGQKVSELPLSIEDQFKRDQLAATQQHYSAMEGIAQERNDIAAMKVNPNGTSGIGDDGSEETPIDSAHMKIVDPDGKEWTVATNSRGTPMVDKKTGMATVFDKNGNTSSRIYNPTYLQQSGQIAQNGAYSINELRHSGNNAYSGGSYTAEAKRKTWNREEASDLQNHIDAINSAARAYFSNKLIQEGVTPTEELVREEAGQAGFLDINNTPERNAHIMDHFRGIFNTGINAARRNQTHASMDESDASTAKQNPVTESAANKAKSSTGRKDHSDLW